MDSKKRGGGACSIDKKPEGIEGPRLVSQLRSADVSMIPLSVFSLTSLMNMSPQEKVYIITMVLNLSSLSPSSLHVHDTSLIKPDVGLQMMQMVESHKKNDIPLSHDSHS